MPRAKERKATKVGMKRMRIAKAKKLNDNPIIAVTPRLLNPQPTPQEQPNTSVAPQSQSTANRPANQTSVLEAQRIITKEIKCLLRGRGQSNTESQDSAIKRAILKLPGLNFDPKKEQVDCIRYLIFDRRNVVLIAKTGFGKSLVMQTVSILRQNTITLSILPLNEIAKEQVAKIESLGGTPLFINSDIPNKNKKIKMAIEGKYTHIFLSPELANSEALHPLLTNPQFKKHLAMIVVDEAHLVTHWGQSANGEEPAFREEFSKLENLRSLVGLSVPLFACSATLDPKTLKDVMKSLVLEDHNTEIVRTALTRKELAFRLGIIPRNTIESYTSLRFLVDAAIEPPINQEVIDKPDLEGRTATPQNIPKTIIFFNTRQNALDAQARIVEYLCCLHPAYTEEKARALTAVFHRNISSYLKKDILREFRKECSKITLVFATEAIGIGVNIFDVRRLVIYQLPSPYPHFAILLQRGGRGGRDGKKAEVIFLFEHWIFGERDSVPQLPPKSVRQLNPALQRPRSVSISSVDSDESDTAQPKPGGTKEDKKKRSVIKDEFYNLANASTCIRKILFDYFLEPESFREENTDSTYCCSRCNPELRILESVRQIYTERGPATNPKSRYILERLENSIQSFAKSHFKDASFEAIPTNIVSFAALEQLSCAASTIFRPKFNEMVARWELADKYSDALWESLQKARNEFDKEKEKEKEKKKGASKAGGKKAAQPTLESASASSSKTPSQLIEHILLSSSPLQHQLSSPPLAERSYNLQPTPAAKRTRAQSPTPRAKRPHTGGPT